MEFLDTFLAEYKDWNFVSASQAGDAQETMIGMVPEKIIRVYPTADFLMGLDFVNDIAAVAQELNHHPHIELDSGKVAVELWTHDVDGVTKKDVALATQIEELYRFL